MFLLIFYSVNCLTTSQINLMTLLGVPTPRFGTSEPLKSSNQISLSCSCCATSFNWCVSKVCHRLHRKSSLCRCVWKPAFVCLHVFFVSVSGSGTNKWAGDLCLTPRAKICFACWLFLLSSFASSNFFFFSPFCPCFPLSCLCLFTFTVEITDSGRCSQEQGCSLPFFVLSFPFFPRWNAGSRACLGFPN